MNMSEIWDAIDNGKTVNWHNHLYELQVVDNNETIYSQPSARGEEAIRITCTSNGFGAYMAGSEIKDCFIKIEP